MPGPHPADTPLRRRPTHLPGRRLWQPVPAPSDTAVRTALLATPPETHELQRRLNRTPQGDLPRRLRRRRQPLAIDLTLLPYHGLPRHAADETYRGQAKEGTSHFDAYATVHVTRKGQRLTVALAYVRQGHDPGDSLRQPTFAEAD